MKRVGLYDDPRFREHDAGPGHPECPERLDAVRRGLSEAGLDSRLVACPPRRATETELLRVHTAEHLERVLAIRERTVRFDADTQAGPGSYDAAFLAAGAVVDAVDRVLDDELTGAFCVVRPPGHHATADRVMGFCLFNNVACGAAHALARGLTRVLVVDFDVHHGNGTQDIFQDDPRVLYISSHAFPFYPGTGALDEVGHGEGTGYTVNVPMPQGMGDADFACLYSEVVEPIAGTFAPELVLVSAGFDAHRGDPLAGMDLTAAGYSFLMSLCASVADASAKGRIVAALEGGYGLDGIADASAAVVRVLLGDQVDPEIAAPDPSTGELALAYRRHFARFWPQALAR